MKPMLACLPFRNGPETQAEGVPMGHGSNGGRQERKRGGESFKPQQRKRRKHPKKNGHKGRRRRNYGGIKHSH